MAEITNHTFWGMEVNGRTFDVGVFISYYWEEGIGDGAGDFYPEVEDFSLTDIHEQLPGGNQIVVPWDDPIRFDILDQVDHRMDEALDGLTKESNE